MDKISALYKFFSIDDYFLSSLETAQLWFSDPLNFNDPYDCNLEVYIEHDFELMLNHFRWFKEYSKSIGGNFSNEQQLVERIKFLYNNSGEMERISRGLTISRVENLGVCCFCKEEYNLLMWSHYANKHHGICLKFNVDADSDFFYTPFEVHYPLAFPKFNYFRQTEKLKKRELSGLAQHLLATKSQDWAYEKEVRVVKDKLDGDYRGLIKINKEAVIEAIFGYKASQESIEKLKEVFINNEYQLKMYKMRLKENDFGLIKELI